MKTLEDDDIEVNEVTRTHNSSPGAYNQMMNLNKFSSQVKGLSSTADTTFERTSNSVF